jgi:hypothetical protein
LFAGIDPAATRDLNSLAKALSFHRQMDKMLKRPGATASTTALMDIFRGLAWATAGAATRRPLVTAIGVIPLAGTIGTDLAARAFTSPKVVRWLVRQTNVPAGTLAQELVILTKQAKDWSPADRDIADAMVKTLGTVDWAQARMMTATEDATPPPAR